MNYKFRILNFKTIYSLKLKKLKLFLNSKFKILNFKGAFTLIELLIVIAIIAVVMAVIFVALNPFERFKDARNAQRWQDIEAITDALRIYQVDNRGQVPSGVDENWKMLGTDTSGCNILCGGGEVSGTFVHDDQTDFDAGLHNGTRWDGGNSWVELSSGNSGTYISEVLDATISNTWTSLSWVPQRPTYKPLLNSGGSESGYSTGNINMSGNVLLYHLNESSGAIVDSSGHGNGGTNSGATYGVSGRFNTTLDFNGAGNIITGPPSNNITGNNLQTITLSAWVKHTYSGDNGYIVSLKRSASPSTLISLDAGNSGAGSLGFLTRSADNTAHTWLNYNGGYNDGQWHHLVAVVNGVNRILYVDGIQRAFDTRGMQSVSGNTAEFSVGGFYPAYGSLFFDGQIDEVAIWTRALGSTEIADIYKRGALRFKFQVRSCDDDLCSGESFVGPDGTASTYYTELNNYGTGLPSFTMFNLDDNRYFQYRANFETDNTSYSPELNSVTLETTTAGEGAADLQSSCLDLSEELSLKLGNIPYDPSDGSPEKTYYAMRRNTNKTIDAIACSAEDESIRLSK